jgi:hypothetical protein
MMLLGTVFIDAESSHPAASRSAPGTPAITCADSRTAADAAVTATNRDTAAANGLSRWRLPVRTRHGVLRCS